MHRGSPAEQSRRLSIVEQHPELAASIQSALEAAHSLILRTRRIRVRAARIRSTTDQPSAGTNRLRHAYTSVMLGLAFSWGMVAATTIGFVIVALGLPIWVGRADPKLGRACAWTMVLGLGLTLALQALTDVPRPGATNSWLPAPPLGSFPSGHAVLMGIALAVTAFHHRSTALLMAPLAAVVAWSRVELGHHHAVDVWAGASIGLGLGWAAAGLSYAPRTDPWRLRWLLWPQLGFVVAITLVAYTGALSGQPWLALPGTDKVLHFLLFGALAFGTHFALRGRRWLGVPLAVAVPLLGALAEELVQATSPHRTADPIDLLADLLGMLLFWRLAERVSRRGQSR
jgi:membrane-associated phospholipid phosphatase/predicted outer membrane lipoprotein